MSETEKRNADETSKIIEEILNYNKNTQKIFLLASKVGKGKSEPKVNKRKSESKVDKGKSEPKVDRRKLELKIKESVAKRVRLGREKIDEIKKKEKNMNDKLFKDYFTIYQSPSNMYKKLGMTEGTRNEVRVYLIKEVLNRMKKIIKNVSENRKFRIEETQKIIDIVERILYFNQLNQ